MAALDHGMRSGARSAAQCAAELPVLQGAGERAGYCAGFLSAVAGELVAWIGTEQLCAILCGVMLGIEAQALAGGDPDDPGDSGAAGVGPRDTPAH